MWNLCFMVKMYTCINFVAIDCGVLMIKWQWNARKDIIYSGARWHLLFFSFFSLKLLKLRNKFVLVQLGTLNNSYSSRLFHIHGIYQCSSCFMEAFLACDDQMVCFFDWWLLVVAGCVIRFQRCSNKTVGLYELLGIHQVQKSDVLTGFMLVWASHGNSKKVGHRLACVVMNRHLVYPE